MGVGMTCKGRKTAGGDEGRGDEEITKLKTNVISAATEEMQCLLLGEACLAVCSRGWLQHYGMILRLYFTETRVC